MTPTLKTVSNLSLGFTELWNDQCQQLFPCQQPPKGEKGGTYLWNDAYLMEWCERRIKTCVKYSRGIPGYGMTNASNFRWGFPPASNPQKVRKGAFILGMTSRLKTLSNLPLGFLEYGMTKTNNFMWGLPCQQRPKGEKGVFFQGMARRVNNTVTSSIWVPWVRNDRSQ